MTTSKEEIKLYCTTEWKQKISRLAALEGKSVSAFIQDAVEAGLSAKNSGISTNDFRHLYFVEALLLWQAHQLLDDENEFKAVVGQCKRKAGIQHD
ncbi:type II toxin-antitoxin system TacA family antitoxin [Acidaminococcus timonensis]|uniref:hypothetical protein n=1 Tax=Acidaminococcus timonensis TaxID=1871002 RepID=UPI0008D9AD12|nr:hypothetical protein [Acidaminococcus timonensis]